MTHRPSSFRARSARLLPRPWRQTGPDSLWRDAAFMRLWLANTIDDFGTQISGLAVPLTAALLLGAGPVQMGTLAAAGRLPYFALGLLAGVLVDRRPKQRLMVVVNWLRFALLALVPLAAALGVLRLELLYGIVLAVGACGVVFDVAYMSWLPDLVDRERLHDANGKLESTYAVAQAAGPGIAGLLVGLVSAPFAIAVDAVSFAGSAALLQGIHPPARADGAVKVGSTSCGSPGVISAIQGVLRDIGDGLRVVWHDRYLRPTTLCNLVVTFFGFIFLAIYILFMVDVLHLSPTMIGVVLTAGGLGAIVGASVAVRLSSWLGFGPSLIWAQIVFAFTGITVPIAVWVPSLAVPMLAASEFLQYGALAVFSIGALSLRQVRVPSAVQGRAAATIRTATSGAALIGSVLGGFLGIWIGLGPTLVVGVTGMGLACFWVILSPLREVAQLSAVAVNLADETATVSGTAALGEGD